MLELPQQRATLLKAHVVFLMKAIFDPRLQERRAAGAVQMHRRMLHELSTRLPAGAEPGELDIAARMAIAPDGLMMSVVTANTAGERKCSRRVWARFVDLLIKDLNQ